jgi:hypothetical protein
MDGTQLYAHKASDCWIYIWVIMDLSPDEHYKKRHVLPGGFIPSPNKPKIINFQDYITFLLYNGKVFAFGMLQKTVFSSLSCFLDSTWQMALVWHTSMAW